MKKALAVLICLGMLGASACSKETTITKTSDSSTNGESQIEVDEGLLTVTITIPASMAEDATQESIDKLVKENGYKSGTLNDDGSVTYVMTKAKHKEILKETAESFDKAFQEIVDSEEYPNIVSITHNDDFTDFKVEYSGNEVGLGDSFLVLTFYYAGGFYGAFSGKIPSNVHVAFVNSSTGEVIQEGNSKDMESDSGSDGDVGSGEKSVSDKLIDISGDVTDLWNYVFVEANSYANSGTSCTGEALDIDFVISNMDKYYNKVKDDKDYIDSLGDEYSDIKSAFNKLFDKATIIYNKLKEETPKANKPLAYAKEIELFEQYQDYFNSATYDLAYGD